MQSENEKAWLCVINTSGTTPKKIHFHLKSTICNKFASTTNKIKIIASRKWKIYKAEYSYYSIKHKVKRLFQLTKRFQIEKEKLIGGNKGVLIRGTAKVDEIVIPPRLRDQELYEMMVHLRKDRVYQLTKERFY